MSKQTSAALSINDLFSDDNADPESGDTASHGPIALKSDRASASAARPLRPAAVDTADYPAGPILKTWCYTIQVSIDSDRKWYYPLGQDVHTCGEVYLISSPATNVNTLVDVFVEARPYQATPGVGTKYTLKSGIRGPITFMAGGTTGTINVGP